MEVLYASHRHGESVLCQRELQERTGCRNRQLRTVLIEVAQRLQRMGSRLNFVQEQKHVGLAK